MKVGLLNSRAAQLSPYWTAFLKELGLELVVPGLSDTEALALGRESLPGEAATVQLALGRILSLGRVDTVLVPQWPAVSGDAWSSALTELLPRRISGLPALAAVPDSPEHAEEAATEVGLRLTRNAAQVRRALEKARFLLHPPKTEMPNLSRASRATVAVIGPRTLQGEEVLIGNLRPALEDLGLYPIFSHELPLADVLRRAERMPNAAKVPAGERELFGAASLLAGKSAVRGLIFVAPARDGAAQAALQRIAARMHKPTLSLALDADQSDLTALEAFRDQVTLGGWPPNNPEQEGDA